VVNALNHCILPPLRFLPKELLLGIAVNTLKTEPDTAQTESSTQEAAIHMAYVEQQCINGYEAMVKHAMARKCTFNKHMWKTSGETIFKKGQLIQVYCSNLDYMFKTEHKVTPKWSQPYRVTKCIWNAYKLAQLDRAPIEGEFSMQKLHAFNPKPRSLLEQVQQQWEEENPEVEESEWEDDTKDNNESQGCYQDINTVWTPLFTGGEHGVGSGSSGAGELETGVE
jgi:hypothetical protein